MISAEKLAACDSDDERFLVALDALKSELDKHAEMRESRPCGFNEASRKFRISQRTDMIRHYLTIALVAWMFGKHIGWMSFAAGAVLGAEFHVMRRKVARSRWGWL